MCSPLHFFPACYNIFLKIVTCVGIDFLASQICGMKLSIHVIMDQKCVIFIKICPVYVNVVGHVVHVV